MITSLSDPVLRQLQPRQCIRQDHLIVKASRTNTRHGAVEISLARIFNHFFPGTPEVWESALRFQGHALQKGLQ